MLHPDYDLLEQKLLELGRQERLLEDKLQAIKIYIKQTIQQSHLEDADTAWNMYEELRSALTHIKSQITPLERTLYSLNRKRN
ncbi:MAG: hypothetical protein WAZ18_02745 [Alphaproteobacteria bacterium]